MRHFISGLFAVLFKGPAFLIVILGAVLISSLLFMACFRGIVEKWSEGSIDESLKAGQDILSVA